MLPLNTFIKSALAFLYNGGEIFAYWKEGVILILAYKVFMKRNWKINFPILLLQMGFGCIIILYFLISNIHKNALPTLRDHLVPMILFLTISIMKIDIDVLKKIVAVFSITLLMSDIMGILQYFFFNLPISLLMGTVDSIDPSGFIQYNTPSFRIMGFERMFGITSGPNTFGLFTAFGIVLLYGVIINKDRFNLSINQIKRQWFILLFSVVCLISSFSRAGWAIAFGGIIILMLFHRQIKKLKYIIVSMSFIVVAVLVALTFFPKATEIISASFSGKEASAAARESDVTQAFQLIIQEPWGHGLGTTDNRYKTVSFFTESAFMNIAYEIGLGGLIYLIFMHSFILVNIKRKSNFNVFSSIAIAIAVPTLLTCFVSVNPYGMPYIYLWWLVLGLGINRSNFITNKY
jgi:O-antigen ligase